MKNSCIKGSIIDRLVEDVCTLREVSDKMMSRVDAYLDAETLELLETKVNPVSWYALTTYDQLSRALLDIEGHGDVAYLRERGNAIGRRTMEAGLYQQLEYLSRTRNAVSLDAYLRDMRLIVTLQGALVSTGTWTAEPDTEHAERVTLLARDVEGYPETLCHSTAGFMTGVSALTHDSGIEWRWERPSENEVHYRMDRDLSALD